MKITELAKAYALSEEQKDGLLQMLKNLTEEGRKYYESVPLEIAVAGLWRDVAFDQALNNAECLIHSMEEQSD